MDWTAQHQQGEELHRRAHVLRGGNRSVDWYFNTLLSRLDDKQNGAIVLMMQRLHEDDLASVLLRGSDEWTVLSLPAIAEQDEEISIGNGKTHPRRAGDVLHPEREPRDVLESLRAQLGPEIFAARYQQQPMPPGGGIIQPGSVRRYDQLPKSGLIIQSWDVANKQGEENDYSVCTTWLVYENNKYYLIDVLRGRFDFPTLRTKVSEQAKLHKASKILNRRCRSGDSADPGIQDGGSLRSSPSTTRKSEWPYNPQSSRMARYSSQTRPHGLQISKQSFSRFQTAGTTIRWTA